MSSKKKKHKGEKMERNAEEKKKVEGQEAPQEILNFAKEYIARKLMDFPAFLEAYGEDWINNQIEKQIQGVQFVSKGAYTGYTRPKRPYIFLGTGEERTISSLLQDSKMMETILHEGIHKILETEERTGCFDLNNKQGEALNEGLTQWMVKKINGKLCQDAYSAFTTLLDTLERFSSTKQVLELSKGNIQNLENVFSKQEVTLLIEQLDTSLNLERNIKEMEKTIQDLNKIIDFKIEGMEGHEKTVHFYRTLSILGNSRFYQEAKKNMTAVEGSLEGYEACRDILKKGVQEKTQEKHSLWMKAQEPFVEHLLEPQYQALVENKKHRDIEGFQKLAKSMACFLKVMEKGYLEEEQIALYCVDSRVAQNEALLKLKEKTEALKEKWEQEILAEISDNRKKHKKMATGISELGELLKEVKWKESDEQWMDKVMDALDIRENKEDMSGLFEYVYEKDDLSNIKDYSILYMKQDRVVIQKKGKPVEVVEDGLYDSKADLKNVEEKERLLDFTIPIEVGERAFIKNFDAFSDWIKSRENDCQIRIAQRTIIVEHEEGAFTYYSFNEKGQVVPLEKEEGKEILYYEAKKKEKEKESWKERFGKMGEWFKQRFTSKTSLKLLAETTETKKAAMQRKKWLFGLKVPVKPLVPKERETENQMVEKNMER